MMMQPPVQLKMTMLPKRMTWTVVAAVAPAPSTRTMARATTGETVSQVADNDPTGVRADADVRDLKTGFEAVEERARSELGMVRGDEVFFQLQPAGSRPKTPPAPEKPRK